MRNFEGLNKLTTLLLKAYLGPFLATFFISLFFLMMQFLWKYVDDLMGKGLDFMVIAELLYYALFNLVPLALPLAIMLSSIMVFGALGESNELTAMKSSGISLMRIMRPITVFILMISVGAFFFANYAWPWSNLKWKTLYYEILDSKPAGQLPEKMFYNEIPNFTIRIDKKEEDGRRFKGVNIYDYSPPHELRKRDVKAEKGEILKSKNPDFMMLGLNNGVIYEEMADKELQGAIYPFRRTYFQKALLKFDISNFKLSRGNEDLFKDSYEMLNIQQLNVVIDSLRKEVRRHEQNYIDNLKNRHLVFRPLMTITTNSIQDSLGRQRIMREINNTPPQYAIQGNSSPAAVAGASPEINLAIDFCHHSMIALQNSNSESKMRNETLVRYEIEWHRKFTLSLACIVIFFIGAPLGAIVRKGGLGTPMVISVLLFLLYHVLTMTGEKMAKAGNVDVFTGMWFSAFILTPIGLTLTWLATRESSLTNVQTWLSGIGNFVTFRYLRKRRKTK